MCRHCRIAGRHVRWIFLLSPGVYLLVRQPCRGASKRMSKKRDESMERIKWWCDWVRRTRYLRQGGQGCLTGRPHHSCSRWWADTEGLGLRDSRQTAGAWSHVQTLLVCFSKVAWASVAGAGWRKVSERWDRIYDNSNHLLSTWAMKMHHLYTLQKLWREESSITFTGWLNRRSGNETCPGHCSCQSWNSNVWRFVWFQFFFFKKYILSTYFVPGHFVGPEDKVVNKINFLSS